MRGNEVPPPRWGEERVIASERLMHDDRANWSRIHLLGEQCAIASERLMPCAGAGYVRCQ